jgi:lipopolysaccharide/colanic/teichoic acid biosynthesis glycosyltransferase
MISASAVHGPFPPPERPLNTAKGVDAGLWQVSGISKVTLDEMVRMDLSYIQHASLVLDLKILLRTPISVLLGYDNGK